MTTPVYERLRDLAHHIAADADRRGESVKVEIRNAEVQVTVMSPSTPHGIIAMRVQDQIRDQDPTTARISDTWAEDCGLGLLKAPDLMVLPMDAVDDQPEDGIDPRTLDAVVEIVSRTNPDNDYGDKLADYPRMGIPVYVIIDPRVGRGAIQVHTDPTPNGYRHHADYVFGETFPMGRWTIDTMGWPRYRKP